MLPILVAMKPSSGKHFSSVIGSYWIVYPLFLIKIWGTFRQTSSCCWYVQDTILLFVSWCCKVTHWNLLWVCLFLFFLCLLLISNRSNIPSFDDYLDGASKTHPFSNCLTLTNNDFANFQHQDKDHIAVAFGLWWISAHFFHFQPV